MVASSTSEYQRTWNSEKERKFLKNWFLNRLSMILAKQRVLDLNKSVATPRADRKDWYREYRRQKKRNIVRRQRWWERDSNNSN